MKLNWKVPVGSFLICIVMVCPAFPCSFSLPVSSKISKTLQAEVRTSKKITITVEFDTPSFSAWKASAKSLPQVTDSISYHKYNQSVQFFFLHWLEKKGFFVQHPVQLTRLLSALQLQVPGYAIPVIASYPSVKSITLSKLPWNISRSFVRGNWLNENEVPPIQDYPFTGKNIQVGIIDTGLDTGDEFKGKSIVGTNFADPEKGWDDVSFHGTAMAGIIGGNGPKWYQKGLAPNVSFRIYKVFSPNDYRPLGILPALEKSVNDRCDIVCLSLNGMEKPLFEGEEQLIQTAISEAKKAGVTIVVPTGNFSFIQDPGTFLDTVTVGASDERSVSIIKARFKERDYILKAYNGMLSLPFTKTMDDTPLVYAGYGRINDFNDMDVKNKIVLIERGPKRDPITFYEKVARATELGAKAVLLLDYEGSPFNPNINQEFSYHVQVPGAVNPVLENPYSSQTDRNRYKPYYQLVPSAMLSYDDGRWLQKNYNEVSLSFDNNALTYFGTYLSKGFVRNKTIKPDFIAPSEKIIAPLQKSNQNDHLHYITMNGSSAASAFVTGAIALIKEAHPDWDQDEIITIMQNTATILRNPVSGLPYNVLYQGAGEVYPDRAIHSTTRIEPALQAYSGMDAKPVELAITNISGQQQRLTIQVECSQKVTEWVNLILKQLPKDLALLPDETKILSFSIPEAIQRSLDFWIHIGEVHAGIHVVGNDHDYRPISAFSVDRTRFSSPLTNIIEFRYSLNECSVITGPTRKYHLSNGYVTLNILNENKRFVAQIYKAYGSMLGDNVFYWDGCVSKYPLHLYKGKFYFELTLFRGQITPEQTVETVISDQVWFEFYVSQSEGASNYLCLACERESDFHRELQMSVNFTKAVQWKQFDIEISFNPVYLFYEDIQLTPSFKENQDILIETQGSNAQGWMLIRLQAKAGKLINLSAFQPILIVKLIQNNTGLTHLQVSQSRLLDGEGKQISYFSQPSQVEIKKEPFLLADFNFDSIVDQIDQEMLITSFGYNIGEVEYQNRLDINQNGRIGPEEIIWLGKEWEQETILNP